MDLRSMSYPRPSLHDAFATASAAARNMASEERTNLLVFVRLVDEQGRIDRLVVAEVASKAGEAMRRQGSLLSYPLPSLRADANADAGRHRRRGQAEREAMLKR